MATFTLTLCLKASLFNLLGTVLIHPLWLNAFENQMNVRDSDRKLCALKNLVYSF